MRPRAASLKVEATMRPTSRANALSPRKGYFFKETAYIFRKGEREREGGAKAGRSGGA